LCLDNSFLCLEATRQPPSRHCQSMVL